MNGTLPTMRDWDHQLTRVTRILNILRIGILVAVLLMLTLSKNAVITNDMLVKLAVVQNEDLLLLWCGIYGFLTMFTFAKPDWQKQSPKGLPNATSVIDILMIAALTHFMGGTPSGFGILILPFLATSCLFSYGRFALLYAGFATILVIIEILCYFGIFGSIGTLSTNFTSNDATILLRQLFLIGSFYLVALLTSYSAVHIAKADNQVRAHRLAYDRISNLAQIVMNRMQEAAIIVDDNRQVWLTNRKAQQYFPNLKIGQHAPFLHALITKWQENPKHDFEELATINNQSMYVRAIPLLQEDIQFLTLFMRSAHERLTEAQTVKLTSLGQLTANLAHEIRNPLSAMRQATGLLQEAEEGNRMAEKMCGIIDKNITRIDKMIEDVSALNKRDRLTPEIIDLKHFWENFVQEFQLTRPESSGCLKVQLPIGKHPKVVFDNHHLQQILWNLCNNAWRHSKKTKGSIVLSARVSADQENVQIRVWDDGPGVAEEHRPTLFDPFFTTEANSGGTGLGLYVARELAHANKGDLRYLGKEKVFELILPKAEDV